MNNRHLYPPGFTCEIPLDVFTFDRFTRLVASSRSRRTLGSALLGLLVGLLGLTNAAAAPCARGQKRCKKRCIPRRQCCTSADCPKGSGKVCRRGRCVCPASKKRCRKRCIPKAACCGGCPNGQVCRQGFCCYGEGDSSSLGYALAPGGPAVIRLCPATTYRGGLVITRNMTLIGAGANSTVIDLSGGTVGITTGVTAELRGLRIQHGRAGTSGGGVLNAGSLVLRQCQVTGNQADAGGGGIANVGRLLLVDSAVTGNRAGGVGGGLYNADGVVILRGSSLVAGNVGGSEGGGIFTEGASSSVELHDDSSLVSNSAAVSGGGIYNAAAPDAVAFFGRSRVDGNQPNECTGTVTCPSF